MRRSRLRLAVLCFAAVVALALVAAFRAPLLRATVAAALDLATGSRVSFGALDLHSGVGIARDVTVARGGEPLLSVDRLEIHYVLRDLLPGGGRRYGLTSVDLQGPRLTAIRHADGSFNFAARARPPRCRKRPPWRAATRRRGSCA